MKTKTLLMGLLTLIPLTSQASFVESVIELEPSVLIDSEKFVFTINTNNQKLGGLNLAFPIPTDKAYAKMHSYSYNVDCNSDGKDEATNVSGNYTCMYDTPGKYTISIGGYFPKFKFNNFPREVDKLVELNNWGINEWSSLKEGFENCKNLKLFARDVPNLTNVRDMSRLFHNTRNVNQNINNWDVSTVTNMKEMFFLSNFNQPLNNWDVSNVTNMKGMFSWNTFNQSLNNWDVSNVTSMKAMFSHSKFNQPLYNWDVSNVTNMKGMFAYSKFDQPLSGWNVGHVTNMEEMFWGSSFNRPLNSWNLSQVTTMDKMFTGSLMSPLNSTNFLRHCSQTSVQNNVSLGFEKLDYLGGGYNVYIFFYIKNDLVIGKGWSVFEKNRNVFN